MAELILGKSIPRTEGADKVTGRALYTDDVTMPGMLHGVTVRSPAARGHIRETRFGSGIPWEQITIVSARDIPGKNRVALIVDDQPYLASEVVNHPEEPILLLAHEDKYLLEEARQAVEFVIEPLPAVFTIEESLANRQTIWGEIGRFAVELRSSRLSTHLQETLLSWAGASRPTAALIVALCATAALWVAASTAVRR